MARWLRGAVVMRTRAPEDGRRAVTSHAKLLGIDHRFLLVGSANLSYSAEERNVELGLRLATPPRRTSWRSSCGTSRGSSTSRCTGE